METRSLLETIDCYCVEIVFSFVPEFVDRATEFAQDGLGTDIITEQPDAENKLIKNLDEAERRLKRF